MKTIYRKDTDKVGKLLREWRKKNNLTQKQCAIALGYKSISPYQKLETGKIRLTVVAFLELCQNLKVNPKEFFKMLI